MRKYFWKNVLNNQFQQRAILVVKYFKVLGGKEKIKNSKKSTLSTLKPSKRRDKMNRESFFWIIFEIKLMCKIRI